MPIDEAIEDEERPGRPPALTQNEREQLRADIRKSPHGYGFSVDSWSIENIQSHIAREHNVDYSEGHIRRMLRSPEVDF